MKTKNRISHLHSNGAFIVMLVPFTVIFILFTVIPAAGGLLSSFTNFNGMTFPDFVGLDNYVRLLLREMERARQCLMPYRRKKQPQ